MLQLPETKKYIASCREARRGHHNYVVKREAGNARTPLTKMSPKEISAFDLRIKSYLQHLDSPP